MAMMASFGGFGTNFGPNGGTVSKESKSAFFYVEAQTTGSTGSTTETEATVAEATPCDASVPPLHGSVGTCTNSLTPGLTCQPTCDAGYTVSGKTTCIGGVLKSATCEFYFCNGDPDTFFPRFGIGRIEQLFLLDRRYGVDDAVEAVEQRVGRERPRVRAHLPAGQDVGSGYGEASLCVH